MSILNQKPNQEEVAAFFKKNKYKICTLLKCEAPAKKKAKAKAKPKKTTKKKKEAPVVVAPVEEVVIIEAPVVTEPVIEEVIEAVVETAPVEEEIKEEKPKAAKKKTTKKKKEAPAVVEADDLTELDGLGATMAQNLADAGITTFADMAALTKKKAEKVGENIRGFLSKFEKKKWRQEAKEKMS